MTKEELQERAQLVRIHEANCNIPYPTPIEANFRLAIMKKLAAEYSLKELRALPLRLNMRAIIAAIHGIMTRQTDPTWPDKLSAWMYERDREVHVTTRHYWAGPFPRWNCWVKDPYLARGLANELELFLGSERRSPPLPNPLLPAREEREAVST